jgi:S1-C subfamily serine protease
MALLPPFFLDAVAAIGLNSDPQKRTWIGTGFIVGMELKEDISKPLEQKRFQLWLITNKHVFGTLKEVYIKFNSAMQQNSKDYPIPLVSRNGRPQWIGHPNPQIDVAAIKLNPGFMKTEGLKFQFFRMNDQAMKKDDMKNIGFTEGDRVFVLGFPMGLVSPDRQYVICRTGCIGRIRDFIEGNTTDYIIDAPVFPGNSGGPVISCPSALAITGTNTIPKADLIGIVKSYIPYQDVAISQQTRNPRIIFEENSGLTAVEAVDSIIETIELAEKRIKGRTAAAKHRGKKQDIKET